MNDFQHLITDLDGEKRLWVTLRMPEGDSAPLLDELGLLFRSAEETTALEGFIFHTAAPPESTSIADIHDFSHLQGRDQLLAFIKKGQETFLALENLNIPSIVLIDGPCPSIFIELALAADYCIASNRSSVKLGFPEVKFGMHTAMGGAQRAIQRMGVYTAMDYLLTGKPLTAAMAAKSGLIDACIPTEELHETASRFMNKRPGKKKALSGHLLNLSPLRPLIALQLIKKAERRFSYREKYPAPNALIRLWIKHGTKNTAPVQQAYAESVAELSQTGQSISLIRLSKLKARLRKFREATTDYNANHIHIIGSSMTASDIATYLVFQEKSVTLQDKRPEAIEQTLQKVQERLADHYEYNEEQINTLMTGITSDQKGEGIKQADLILVTKTYNLSDSQEVFADLEERAKPDAILASHSTIIPLGKIAAALLKPERLIGIHFCYPAFQTDLTEISYDSSTDPKVIKQALLFIRGLNKTPLPLKNSPGLLVDRILTQYILQGIRLQQQGVPHTIIDKAGRTSGMPHGPLELADRIGLDYCLRISEVLEKAFKIEIPFSLIEMVKTGKLGIKSGTGFYRYRNGNRLKPARVDWSGSEQALQDKLVGQITEEASICLEDGLIEDPDLIDAGIVFGTGFAPFTGGPLYLQRNRQLQNKRA